MTGLLFVGIDWGARTHAVCVVDATGRPLLEREVPHRGDDVLAFVAELLALAGGDATRILAAMEAPHGVMVEALLERGVATHSINPKQLDRFRDRHSAAGAKDDDLDAYVLAVSLRTDRHLFRKIELASPQLLQLSSLSRTYQSLTDQVRALANQVREQLQRYFPQMLELGGDWHEDPWLWALFDSAPTPALAARLTKRRVEGILKAHRIRRRKPEEVVLKLRETPLPVAPGVPHAASTRIAKLLPVLRAAHQQRVACTKEMADLLESMPKPTDQPDETDELRRDAGLVLSLPGIGVHISAVLLTDAGAALQLRDYQALRRLAGVAPVSKRTGGKAKRPQVEQRRACSHRVREAAYHWGRVAVQREPRARAHYSELRARGHSHGRAIRGVVDRLLKVLLAVLTSGSPYDPTRRGGAGDAVQVAA